MNRFVRVEVAECFKIDLNNEGSFHSLLAAYLAGLPRKNRSFIAVLDHKSSADFFSPAVKPFIAV